MVDDKIEYNLEYKQWNHFFRSLQNDIDEIKTINKVIRIKTDLIHEFYSLINTLFNNHKTYIGMKSQQEDIQETLDKIEKRIYAPNYIHDLKQKNISSPMIIFQHQNIKDLEDCYQTMIMSFETNSLIPKKVIKEKFDPKKAMSRGNE